MYLKGNIDPNMNILTFSWNTVFHIHLHTNLSFFTAIKIPFITIGCHADNGKLIDHIRPNTAFDELTIWNKALSTNRTVDEIQYFLGGYGI